MAKITMQEQEEWPVLPPDTIIRVRVEDTRVKDVESDRGNWQKLEFTFAILGVPDEERYGSLTGSKIWGSVGFRFTNSPDNKLRQWAEALLGMELGVGFELDTDLLIGREARAIVSNYERKKVTDPKTGLPAKAHQVDALLPAQGPIGLGQPTGAPSSWGSAPVAEPSPPVSTSTPTLVDEPPF